VQLVTADPDAAQCPDRRQRSTPGKEWTLTRQRDLHRCHHRYPAECSPAPVGLLGGEVEWLPNK
jgi:hypothetical protein